MNRVEKSAVVPYTPVQMFDLVNAVSDYPAFLPWCQAGRSVPQGEHIVEATLDIAWAGFSKSFTTRNTLHFPDRISLQLARGPFRHLEGKWLFEAIDQNACKVSLELEFELAGGFLDTFFQPVFYMIANSMVDAFCKRAEALYSTQNQYEYDQC